MGRINVCILYVFELQSYVAGHHMYKDIWTPTLGEKLSTTTEPENHDGKYAVKILKENEVLDIFLLTLQSIVPPQFCVGDYNMWDYREKTKETREWA